VPEHPTVSIKAVIAPQIADGLHALAQKCLASGTSEPEPKDHGKARKVITNTSTGTVHGTLFQIGNVEGNVNYRDR
jgi:hypothetical protein